MIVFNLTQHNATPEQVAAGVRALPKNQIQTMKDLLTFDTLPTREDVEARARALAALVYEAAQDHCHNVVAGEYDPLTGWGQSLVSDLLLGVRVMIGGAPFLMGPLSEALRARGLTPVYAFSQRESEDQTQPDGSIKKITVFRHQGFIEG